MTYYCKYHVLDVASWQCPVCHIDYCEACSPDEVGEPGATHYCPHCNGELRPLGGAHAAQPFWMRLTDFIRSPLSQVGVLLMGVAFFLPVLVSEGPIAKVVELGVLLLVAKYGWSMFEVASSGSLESPEVSKLIRMEGAELALSVGTVLAAFAIAIGYVFPKSAFYGALLATAFLCLTPLIMVAAGVNRSIGSALSVEGLKASLMGVGPMYAVICVLILGLFVILQSFVSLFSDILPLVVGKGLASCAYAYFVMVIFSLSGYLTFQFQDALGFVARDGVRFHRARKRIDSKQVRLEMMLKEGNYVKALAILKEQVQKKGCSLAAHERYQKLLSSMNDQNGMRQHAEVYFRVLLDNGYDSKALSLMRSLLGGISGYRPEDPDLCYDLAVAFERLGDYRLAVHVLNGLHRDASNFVRLPEAYLMAARLLAGALGVPEKALALVRFLEGRYRNHPMYPEIKRALTVYSNTVSGS